MIVHVLNFFVRGLKANMCLLCVKMFSKTKIKRNSVSSVSRIVMCYMK